MIPLGSAGQFSAGSSHGCGQMKAVWSFLGSLHSKSNAKAAVSQMAEGWKAEACGPICGLSFYIIPPALRSQGRQTYMTDETLKKKNSKRTRQKWHGLF